MRYFLAAATALLAFAISSVPVLAQAPLAVLMPGSGGVTPIDFVVRNEANIRAAGIQTVITTSPEQAASLIQAAVEKKQKVVLVGMSRGALDVAHAIQAGARPDGVVLVSGLLMPAMHVLRSPDALPATLVIHHQRDQCERTQPATAQKFVNWSGGKAKLHWINNTGKEAPNPCGPRGAHGFFMSDGAAVSAIVAFIRAR